MIVGNGVKELYAINWRLSGMVWRSGEEKKAILEHWSCGCKVGGNKDERTTENLIARLGLLRFASQA